jgi:hypothetical protein
MNNKIILVGIDGEIPMDCISLKNIPIEHIHKKNIF